MCALPRATRDWRTMRQEVGKPVAWSLLGVVKRIAALLVIVLMVLPAAAETPSFGMNFSFDAVEVRRVQSCPASRSVTVRNAAFLTRYDQPKVRARVRSLLSGMRRSGLVEVRTLIFFGSPALSDDWFRTEDAERAAGLVRSYIDDLAAAGMRGAIIGFGPQGISSPACRRERWGDCFDAAKLEPSWTFIESIRRAIGDSPPLRMRYDLGNEMCAPPNLPRQLREALERYLRFVVPKYVSAFPRDETTVSCALMRFAEGQPTTDAIYREAGGRPAFYDVHTYRKSGEDAPAVLARALARRPDRPFIVGEISYGHRSYVDDLIGVFRRYRTDLQAVYFWPLRDAASRCTADVAPPYTLDDALGR